MTKIPDDLLAAYDATDYHIEDTLTPLVVHIGKASPGLAALHARLGVRCSAMVTAWNPYSQPRSDAENLAANAVLFADLAAQGHRWIPAVGRDPSGKYAPEPGVFIPGISYEEAFALGKKYHQNAIVYMGEDATPRLGLCE